MVGEGGLEPPRGNPHWHLKPARLPFRHSPEQHRNATNVTANHHQPIAVRLVILPPTWGFAPTAWREGCPEAVGGHR
jgi:hypothetical protein